MDLLPPPAFSREATLRSELLDRLKALPPTLFEELLFRLKPPLGLIPPAPADQSTRSMALITWAEWEGGIGLTRVSEELGRVGRSSSRAGSQVSEDIPPRPGQDPTDPPESGKNSGPNTSPHKPPPHTPPPHTPPPHTPPPHTPPPHTPPPQLDPRSDTPTTHNAPAEEVQPRLIFISYNRANDAAFARALADNLRRWGMDPWLDEEQIPTSQDVLPAIQDVMTRCHGAVFVLSRPWLKGRWTHYEL